MDFNHAMDPQLRGGDHRSEPFNYDKVKQGFKVPYSPHRDFTTMHKVRYVLL